VTDKSQACVVSCIGAAIGAAAAYLFFTDQGRQLRARLEPALEDFTRELDHFRGTVTKAAGAAGEGWKVLNEALGENGAAAARHTPSHQTSPF
jgi:gas vesicle protein